MELRHIRYFVAAAEEGNFRRGAQRLHISEPALGVQIRELERECGVELFERLPRGVRLSAAGKALLEDARKLLGGFNEAIEHARVVARGDAGTLRVGHVSRGSLRPRAASLIPAFCARYPHVDVKALELSTPEQWKALRESAIDVGITYVLPDTELDLKSDVIDETMLTGAVLPANHALARKRPLYCRDLSALPYLTAPRNQAPTGQSVLLAEFRARGLEVQFAEYEFGDPTMRVGLVAIGAGWIVSSESGAEAYVLGTPGVVFRQWADAPIPSPCFAVWRGADSDSPLIAAFLTVARELRDSPRHELETSAFQAGRNKLVDARRRRR